MTRLQVAARLGIVGGIWPLLHIYLGAHVLGPAPITGVPRVLAWGAVVLVAWLPLIALITARRTAGERNGRGRGFTIRVLDWVAYTAMGLSSLLIVSFFATDLLRLPASATVVLVVVGAAAFLTLVGMILARRPLVVGVTDLSAASDPAAAVAGAPPSDVRVLLAHQPRSAFAAQAAGYDLQLSGHTHGGQYFPFNLLVRLFQPFVAGLHRLESMWLYVSRGTGYWGPPLRLGAPAEITLLELQPSPR